MNENERIRQLEEQLRKTVRVLNIATERAIKLGNRVNKLGEADINRGQFQSLVEKTLEDSAKVLGVSLEELDYL